MSRTRRPGLIGLILVLSITQAACSGAPAPTTTPSPTATASAMTQLEETSRKLAVDFEEGRSEPILAIAGDEMKKTGLNTAMLDGARTKITDLAGSYRQIIGSFATSDPKGDVVSVITQHDTKAVRILFSFSPDAKTLNGFHLNLATDDEVTRARSGSAPTTSAASATPWPGTGAHAKDEAVLVGRHNLPGTLSVPSGVASRPIAVILLAGSGPQDRDETIGASGNKPLRDIADGLASQGITTLRFDKRTKAAPATLTSTSTVADEYLDDTAAAVSMLAGRADLSGYKIFILGHSQSAMLLPTLLQQNPGVAGGISMAGSPRSIFDIAYDQYATSLESSGKSPDEKQELLKQQRSIMDQAKALKDPSTPPPAAFGSTMSAAYIVSLNQQTPVETALSVQVPLLFLQGDADLQVSLTKDFEAWKTALANRPDTTFHNYPKLNHLFMPTTGQLPPADYDTPATVDPAVIKDITDWLTTK